VDVDGSYLYRKYRLITEAEGKDSEPLQPSPPLSGWRVINIDSFNTIGTSVPTVKSGKLCMLLSLKW